MASDRPSIDDPIRAALADTQAMAVFGRQADSVGEAREWLGVFLRRHRMPDGLCRDAVLIISELVTNALRHGLGEIVTRTSLSQEVELRISVTDSGSDLPEVQPIDPERIGGVGLRIVDQLATAWGIAPFPGGKTVWATLSVAPLR